jgi:hypothetical protein
VVVVVVVVVAAGAYALSGGEWVLAPAELPPDRRGVPADARRPRLRGAAPRRAAPGAAAGAALASTSNRPGVPGTGTAST